MIQFEPAAEAKKKVWARLSRFDGEFVIFLFKCLIHTVEACVNCKRQEHVDEFEFFVLKTIRLVDGADIEKINSVLHIGRQILKQITSKLIRDKLLTAYTNGSFELTALGQDVLDTGRMLRLEKRRCIFHFVDGVNEFVRIGDSGHKFLVDCAPHETDNGWNFDIETLRQCVSDTDDWKQRRQFPMDVHELVTTEPEVPSTKETNAGGDTLVVDKAQYVNCAVIVRFNNDMPFELTAYPISPTGHLLAMEQVFSLRDEESILRVFPFVNEIPDKKQLLDTVISLCQRYMIGNIENIRPVAHKTRITIEGNSNGDNWERFFWQYLQGNIFCDIAFQEVIRLNKLYIEGDSACRKAVNLLFEIHKSYLSEGIIDDIGAYTAWLSRNPHCTDVSIRKLSCLAWEFGHYRLAYKLAQLEDIADAMV